MAIPLQTRQLHGYHRLAGMMGKSDELAIFRRFNDMNMLSLLSLQAEILEQRDNLYMLCDGSRGDAFSTSMLRMKNDTGAGKEQHDAIKVIRGKMQQYSKTIAPGCWHS